MAAARKCTSWKPIQDNYMYLLENLTVKPLIDQLYESHLLTLDDYEHVNRQANHSPNKETLRLVLTGIQRLPDGYPAFLNALREPVVELSHVADHLDKMMKQQQNKVEDQNIQQLGMFHWDSGIDVAHRPLDDDLMRSTSVAESEASTISGCNSEGLCVHQQMLETFESLPKIVDNVVQDLNSLRDSFEQSMSSTSSCSGCNRQISRTSEEIIEEYVIPDTEDLPSKEQCCLELDATYPSINSYELLSSIATEDLHDPLDELSPVASCWDAADCVGPDDLVDGVQQAGDVISTETHNYPHGDYIKKKGNRIQTLLSKFRSSKCCVSNADSGVRIVFYGPTDVGKSTVITSFMKNKYEMGPPTHNIGKHKINVPFSKCSDDQQQVVHVQCEVIDVKGNPENISYLKEREHRGHVYVACLAVDKPETAEELEKKWHPKMKKIMKKGCQLYLLGLRSDMSVAVDDKVTQERGEALQKQLGAYRYVECSAVNGSATIQRLFKSLAKSGARALLESHGKRKK